MLPQYRSLLRTSNNFSAYNFREYAKRRTRDSFRSHQHESDPEKINSLVKRAEEDLKMLQRQTTLSQFFQLDRLVVEGGVEGKDAQGARARQKETGWD